MPAKSGFSIALFLALLLTLPATDLRAEDVGTQAPLLSRPATRVGLNLEMEVEFEFVDVEGKGGFSNRDPSLVEPEVRSAYMHIDKAVLAPSFLFGEWGVWTTELRLQEAKAYVDRSYLQLRAPLSETISLVGEVGRNNPMAARSRRTEAYPIIGTAFWKGRELHLTGGAEAFLGPVDVNLRLSVATKRPLKTDDLAEDKSFKSLASGDSVMRIGNEMEYGALLGIGAFGVQATAFGYTGKLIDKSDIEELDQTINGYRALGDVERRSHEWYGGRLSYADHGLNVVLERIHARDGHLPRQGWYAEASFDLGAVLTLPWVDQLEPLVRTGELLVRRITPDPREPATWDRRMQVIALLVGRRNVGTVRIEYYRLNERGRVGAPVADNQLLIQLELKSMLSIIEQGEI